MTDEDLHAYVDGALAPARAAEIEAWLADHPEDAARVRLWRGQIEGLHRLFDPVLDEPIPEHLKLAKRRRPVTSLLLRLAASLLLVGFGFAAGWWQRGPSEMRTPMVAEALAAHVVFASEVRHPVEVPASDHAHLVGWLSKRLGGALRTPDLSAVGFSLVGGRLLPATQGPAAQFMYEDATGQRVTIYLRRTAETSGTAFRFAGEGRANAFYWIDGGFAYAIVGGLPRAGLTPIAHEVYRQLAS